MVYELSEETQKRLIELREAEENARLVFRRLGNEQLVEAARHWMHHCEAPKRIEPNKTVYDSTFWHVIVPELIKRVENQSTNHNEWNSAISTVLSIIKSENENSMFTLIEAIKSIER